MVADLFTVLGPVMVVALGALLCIGSEAFLSQRAKHGILPWIAALSLMLAGVALIPGVSTEVSSISGVLLIESSRAWIQIAVLASALCGIAALQHGLRRNDFPSGEGYALMLLCTIGVMIMVQAGGYLVLYIGLEMASLATYALIGMYRHRLESGEALFKYFIMGAVFSAILAYGMALTYGATGSIAYGSAPLEGREPLFLIGQALVIIGLLFKVGAVPLHTWTPDAYTGSSIGVTGFMAATMKVGAFVALIAVWLNALSVYGGEGFQGPLSLGMELAITEEIREKMGPLALILVSVAMLSLLLGNFSALGQTHLRRLMAFSGIAHAGYILLALAFPKVGAVEQQYVLWPVWYYVIAYGLAAAGVMLAAGVMAGKEDHDSLARLAGGARRHPLAGIGFTILVASLAGLPPTAGFLGKFFILSELVGKGEVLLAIVAMLMAVVGAVFYVRLIMVVWGREDDRLEKDAAPPMCALGTLALMIVVVATIALLAVPSVVAGLS